MRAPEALIFSLYEISSAILFLFHYKDNGDWRADIQINLESNIYDSNYDERARRRDVGGASVGLGGTFSPSFTASWIQFSRNEFGHCRSAKCRLQSWATEWSNELKSFGKGKKKHGMAKEVTMKRTMKMIVIEIKEGGILLRMRTMALTFKASLELFMKGYLS